MSAMMKGGSDQEVPPLSPDLAIVEGEKPHTLTEASGS